MLSFQHVINKNIIDELVDILLPYNNLKSNVCFTRTQHILIQTSPISRIRAACGQERGTEQVSYKAFSYYAGKLYWVAFLFCFTLLCVF